MARINYGQPVQQVTERTSVRRGSLGNGFGAAPTQRVAELALAALRDDTRF